MRNLKLESLSPLEKDVLSLIWPSKRMKVRQIHSGLRKKGIALTSVAVICDRLHKKGLLDREVEKGRGGMHYIYHPKKCKAEYEQTVVKNVVDRLIDRFGANATNYFNERFGKR